MTTFHFVRHGESYGNEAAKAAKESGALRLDIPWDTPEIPLTQKGIHQAMGVEAPAHDLVVTSPYKRAVDTMHWALQGPSLYMVDGRLIDKQSGIFDKLSVKGMKTIYPNEWGLRQKLGKFYHRPPDGESWLGVMGRIMEFMESKAGRYESVLVFTHDVPILVAIMIARGLSVSEILDFQKVSPIKNGSVTTLEYEGEEHAAYGRDRLVTSRG